MLSEWELPEIGILKSSKTKSSFINKLIIGSAQFGMPYGIANNDGQVKKSEVNEILKYAYKISINTLDTSRVYGSSEETIGKYLKEHTGERWRIITKVNSKADSIEVQVTKSIDNLCVTPEIVLAHSAADYFDPSFQYELHRLKETKNIKKVGVSVYTNGEIREILFSRLPDIIQCPLNILDAKLHRNGILNELKARKINIHIRSVFLQGLFYLSDEDIQENFPDAFEAINQLQIIAQKAGITLAELSLLWVCSLKQVDKVIIGVDNVYQLKSHYKTLKKEVNPAVFEEALSIKYENDNILNPSLWPVKS